MSNFSFEYILHFRPVPNTEIASQIIRQPLIVAAKTTVHTRTNYPLRPLSLINQAGLSLEK